MNNPMSSKEATAESSLEAVQEFASRLASGAVTLRQARKFFDGENPYSWEGIFPISVQHGAAVGYTLDTSRYNDIHSQVTDDDFPVAPDRNGPMMLEYITFRHKPSTQDVIDVMQRLCLRFPNLLEAETFLDTYPEEVKRKSIVALCGRFGENCMHDSVAYLAANVQGRQLCIHWLCHVWEDGYHFLAVQL